MIRTLLFGLLFGVLDLMDGTEPSGTMVSPHYSVLEPDTQQIVRRGPERLDDGATLYVVGGDDDERLLADRGLDADPVEVV